MQAYEDMLMPNSSEERTRGNTKISTPFHVLNEGRS
jgi:hypothetical protein